MTIQDTLSYFYGYARGRLFALPHSFTDLTAVVLSKFTSFVTLPLPLLSFLALPFFGGSSTTINLAFFYLTWSVLVWSYDPVTVELYGTLAVRLIFFVLPALAFLAYDCAFPGVSKGIKAQGKRHLPSVLGRNKLLEVTGVAIFNVICSAAFQAILEQVFTGILHVKSILKVTTIVPLPWGIAIDVLRGFWIRSILSYLIHRFVLHTYDSNLQKWHLQWQHSIDPPFSLVAAYDHPVNYLVSEWLPTFAPAYIFRWHILTWQIFLALVCLEELFVFSGYNVLPSTIILTGMARRTEAHFRSVKTRRPIGNFGHLGIIDFLAGTACKDEVDVVDDLRDEVDKHGIQERIEDAVNKAMAGADRQKKGVASKIQNKAQKTVDDGKAAFKEDSGETAGDDDGDGDDAEAAPRKRGRKKGRKD